MSNYSSPQLLHQTPLFRQSVSSPSPSPSPSLPLLLQRCSTINQFKQVHAHAIKLGLHHDQPTAAKLLRFCSLSPTGDPAYAALLLLRSLHQPDVFMFNTVIRSLCLSPSPSDAFALYISMLVAGVPPNSFTFPFLLKSCSRIRASHEGQQLHAHILKLGLVDDLFVRSTLVNMYAQSGLLDDASQVFVKGSEREPVSRTALIRGYAGAGRLDDARRLFDESTLRDVVSWNAMIAGYAQGGRFDEALALFSDMIDAEVEPNESTMVSVLSACANSSSMDLGRWVHSWIDQHGLEPNLRLINALIDMYLKCGDLETGRKLFDELSHRDRISWNIMIGGYNHNGRYKEALELFREMQRSNVQPNDVTLLSILPSCAYLGALDLGRWIHAYIDKNLSNCDNVSLFTSLIDMYTKCGNVEIAAQIFHKLGSRRSLASWNAMISGLAMHGRASEAQELFTRMLDEGIKPDDITFIGILAACSHTGMVDEGWRYFNSMSNRFGISPKIQHYGCMIDLLGRAALFDDAKALIENMTVKADGALWGSLLGSCCVHGNLGLAEDAARHLLELEPDNPGVYMLLSNTYARAGWWDDVARIRTKLKDRGMKKTPGCSLIEVDSVVHEFLVYDKRHPRCDEIYDMVDEIDRHLEMAGHVPDTSEVVFDMDEEGKADMLRYHSERLAIAFGFISTKPEATIRIVKNLRVCGNCHSATKLISKIFNREIIARDRNRFHHFKDGSCSCNDYW
ncbi:pentatricopeptide repeat-containing protein At1g08070, chloroplastic [Nymphaea colorata]|uniref:DYW domain-containing protein n=1 Tax=Nymphaea colorata TaxID=210225 RepID=A0A5K1E3S5_9MAGN|nr:pentatricopeptide repeat-containing protein At1g08070, chloroplastic [Nymphaea colorata]